MDKYEFDGTVVFAPDGEPMGQLRLMEECNRLTQSEETLKAKVAALEYENESLHKTIAGLDDVIYKYKLEA